ADRNRSHWSTSKTPSYTKSVSWQHHRISHTFVLGVFQSVKKFFATLASKNETGIIEMGCCAHLK
ncbi:hypothetical protein, partial [Escherichia coli]|uniref:hypothetical protein n=1 Tax=Escherichia coli TaxID=562 RepID=UPI001BC89C91